MATSKRRAGARCVAGGQGADGSRGRFLSGCSVSKRSTPQPHRCRNLGNAADVLPRDTVRGKCCERRGEGTAERGSGTPQQQRVRGPTQVRHADRDAHVERAHVGECIANPHQQHRSLLDLHQGWAFLAMHSCLIERRGRKARRCRADCSTPFAFNCLKPV